MPPEEEKEGEVGARAKNYVKISEKKGFNPPNFTGSGVHIVLLSKPSNDDSKKIKNYQ